MKVGGAAARRRVRQPRHRPADAGVELHRRPRRHAALRERHPRLRRRSRAEGEEDIDLYNASGQLVTPLPGTRVLRLDRLVRHGAHRARLDRSSSAPSRWRQNGDLANWNIPADRRRRHRRRDGPRRRRRAHHRGLLPAASATARSKLVERAHLPADRARLRRSRWSPTSPRSTSTPTASCCASSRRA